MIEKIGHYSLESPASIYDEEALTALELAGRTAKKVNECIERVNKIPKNITDEVQTQIDNGTFDKQIDQYAGELEKQISDNEKALRDEIEENYQDLETDIDGAEARMEAKYNNLAETLGNRVDNMYQVPAGSTTMDAEVIDIRSMFNGSTADSAGSAIREQFRLAHALHTGRIYAGNSVTPYIIKEGDGSITIKFPGELTGMVNGAEFYPSWSDVLSNIPDYSTYSGIEASINLPVFNTLVYKNSDGKFYIRHNKSVGVDEIPLLANGWSEVLGGLLADEWVHHNQYLESAHRAQIVYHTWPPAHKFTTRYTHTDGVMYLLLSVNSSFTAKCVRGGIDGTVDLAFTTSRVEPLGDYYFEENGLYNILIPVYYILVYNYCDDKFYLRRYASNLRPEDIIMVTTAWAAPISGSLVDNYTTYQAHKFDQFITGEEQGVYVPSEGVVTTHCGRFLDDPNGESILFFTDPHLCQKWEDWEAIFADKMAKIKNVYDSMPGSHVICGGDWLGSTDTQAEACFRLGFVTGKMRDMFGDKYHGIVGNHDTNYQGVNDSGESNTGLLPQEVINGVWYDGKPAYYDFHTKNTRFFVFDTNVDWSNTMTDYFLEQLTWFIGQLKNNTDKNLAVGLHILYVTTPEDGTLNILAECVTAIAHAFNTRGSYSLNGTPYTFGGCTGTVRFMLCGHTHSDWTGTVNNIPVLNTTNVRSGDGATFDLIFTDYTHGKLYADRVGTGESRVINI